MEAKDWLLLQTLYEKKNITKTAEVLYISQPALTYRIHQLEKEFDVTIIHRGRRGIEFTPQGEYLLNYAKSMLLQFHKTKEYLQSMDNKISGTLKIGSATSFGHHKLPRILKQFNIMYPDSEFKVVTKWSTELINLMLKQDMHISFIRGEAEWSGEKQLLMTENLCIVSDKEISLSELPYLPRIIYKTDPALAFTLDNWWKETFLEPPFITMEVDNMDTCKRMVENGLGYAILPTMIFSDNKNLFHFLLKLKSDEPLLRKTWMIYRKESLKIPLIREFVKFISENNYLFE